MSQPRLIEVQSELERIVRYCKVAQDPDFHNPRQQFTRILLSAERALDRIKDAPDL